MSEQPGSQPGPTLNVRQLRELRAGLNQLIRELMAWIGLLRHKAMTLRSLAARPASRRGDVGSPSGLVPGSLDPRAVAEVLANGMSRLRPRPAIRGTLSLVGVGADEVIERARALWDTVADPADAVACERLADSAERLAAQLQDRLDLALDEYQALGDELVRALRREQAEPLESTGGVNPRGGAPGAADRADLDLVGSPDTDDTEARTVTTNRNEDA